MLRRAGLAVECELAESDRTRLVNVFAKCESDPAGATRGRRHVMFDDSDINYTRHIRGIVNAVIASVTGDTMRYVAAGAEHQGCAERVSSLHSPAPSERACARGGRLAAPSLTPAPRRRTGPATSCRPSPS